MDPEWVLEKTSRVGLPNLISDYSFDTEVECCIHVASALRMLSTGVGNDPAQVASQLVARLSLLAVERVERMVRQLKGWKTGPWLVPLTLGLTPVGTPLEQTLVGHSKPVRQVTPGSADRVISASDDGELIVWHLSTGAEVARWVTGIAVVLGMRSLGEDHVVIDASESPTSVVRLSDGRVLHHWDRTRNYIKYPVLDSYLTSVALALSDRRIEVIDGIDGTNRLTISGVGPTASAVFVGTDMLVTTAEATDTGRHLLLVWSLSRREVIHRIAGHDDEITGLAALAGFWVASASRDKSVKIWDLATGRLVATHTGHGQAIKEIQAVGSRLIASWAQTGPVHLWDRATGRLEVRLDLPETDWLKLMLLPDGRVLSSDGHGRLTTWSLGSGRKLNVLAAHGGLIWDMRSAGGFRVLTASEDRTVKVWNLAAKPSTSPARGPRLDGPVGVPVYHVTEPRHGRTATCSSDGSVALWDVVRGRLIARFKGHSAPVRTATLSRDGRTLVTGSDDRTLIVWDLQTRTPTRTLTGHTAWVTSALFLTDRYLASASQDGTIRIWDVLRGVTLGVLSGHRTYVQSMALASPGLLVSGDEDGILFVWDWNAGLQVHRLVGHSGVITGIRPAGNGRVVSASLDRTVRVWDVRVGKYLLAFTGHHAPVQALAVSRGGHVLSGDRGGVLCGWGASSGHVRSCTSIGPGGIVSLTTSQVGVAAAATDGNRLVLWDLPSGRALATYTAEHPLTHCSISATARRVVAADMMGNVHILKYVPGNGGRPAARLLQDSYLGLK
jgi:WD40 repeat protein